MEPPGLTCVCLRHNPLTFLTVAHCRPRADERNALFTIFWASATVMFRCC